MVVLIKVSRFPLAGIEVTIKMLSQPSLRVRRVVSVCVVVTEQLVTVFVITVSLQVKT